tara:strand:+ start:538 stop:801 length:264 start_codon:yes stop_codon:yes gene_type:complete
MSGLEAVSPIPVPTGWRFVLEDDMPTIERDVGSFTLTVGLDDGKWRWWLCPRGRDGATNHGVGADMVDAVWQVFDALARRLTGRITR